MQNFTVAVSFQALADCWEIASVSSISVSMHQSQTFFKSRNSMSCLDLSFFLLISFTSALTLLPSQCWCGKVVRWCQREIKTGHAVLRLEECLWLVHADTNAGDWCNLSAVSQCLKRHSYIRQQVFLQCKTECCFLHCLDDVDLVGWKKRHCMCPRNVKLFLWLFLEKRCRSQPVKQNWKVLIKYSMM